MDKYQNQILNKFSREIVTLYAYADSNTVNIGEGLYREQLNPVNLEEQIEIKQSDDITITKYDLFFINQGISAVYAIKEKECLPFQCTCCDYHWGKVYKDRQVFHYTLDFDDKITSVKIVFKNNIADDLILPIRFIDADKDVYYAKKEAERIAKLGWKASVSCATGQNLVNIYFQPCADNYAKTEITLYRSNLMMAKYIVEGELYFKAIPDLAYGDYSFVLKQISTDEKILYETTHIRFSVSMPQYNHKPTISW